MSIEVGKGVKPNWLGRDMTDYFTEEDRRLVERELPNRKQKGILPRIGQVALGGGMTALAIGAVTGQGAKAGLRQWARGYKNPSLALKLPRNFARHMVDDAPVAWGELNQRIHAGSAAAIKAGLDPSVMQPADGGGVVRSIIAARRAGIDPSLIIKPNEIGDGAINMLMYQGRLGDISAGLSAAAPAIFAAAQVGTEKRRQKRDATVASKMLAAARVKQQARDEGLSLGERLKLKRSLIRDAKKQIKGSNGDMIRVSL